MTHTLKTTGPNAGGRAPQRPRGVDDPVGHSPHDPGAVLHPPPSSAGDGTRDRPGRPPRRASDRRREPLDAEGRLSLNNLLHTRSAGVGVGGGSRSGPGAAKRAPPKLWAGGRVRVYPKQVIEHMFVLIEQATCP